MDKLQIGVLASHSGTTLQAMIDACERGDLDAQVCVVISNNSRSGAAGRADRHGIPLCHLSSCTHEDEIALDDAICETLERFETELVMLAGYMKKIGPRTLAGFRGRILNTHPALLPKFGGQGMYGDRVHSAVLQAGDPATGVSIHLVDSEYDTGPVVAQCEVCVEENDDVQSLSDRVKIREKEFLIETLQAIAKRKIKLPIID
ncbi:MAG: phosphoribosylglycinamide formyltransferase [Planctomycetes bacterium]|nr:phosphoribosylglycinamide formyltransferase [Planctomycetota bacterium]